MLDAILKPRTVAIVGASRSPNTIGHQLLANLVRHGFTGAVFPVNPKAGSVGSIRAAPSVAAIGEPRPSRRPRRPSARPPSSPSPVRSD